VHKKRRWPDPRVDPPSERECVPRDGVKKKEGDVHCGGTVVAICDVVVKRRECGVVVVVY
jgi:hypothetical protein